MSENLKKIIILEEKLDNYLIGGIDTTNIECENVVLEISELLKLLDNDELLYLLINGNSIHQVIDVYVLVVWDLKIQEIRKKPVHTPVFHLLAVEEMGWHLT